jgi:hypothetical protein
MTAETGSMQARETVRQVSAALAAVCLVAILPAGSASAGDEPLRRSEALEAKLADAYRVDLSSVRVRYDYWPRRERVRGVAELRFTMRAGQRRALFHFNPIRDLGPGRERRMLRTLVLDGVRLNPSDHQDLRLVRTRPSAEPAYELRRRLHRDRSHTLRVTWTSPIPNAPRGWLYPKFDDTEGPNSETETLWPTVSSPEELARHRIRIRVHGQQRYTVLGSGRVKPLQQPPVQTWQLDTGRQISTSNVFFAAVPVADVRTRLFEVGDTTVRIVSDRPPLVIRRGKAVVRRTIPQLVDELRPWRQPGDAGVPG